MSEHMGGVSAELEGEVSAAKSGALDTTEKEADGVGKLASVGEKIMQQLENVDLSSHKCLRGRVA